MSFDDSVSNLIAITVESLKDRKLTLSELRLILMGLTETISEFAVSLGNPGAEKKALVLDAISAAFLALWPLVTLPVYLVWAKPLIVYLAQPWALRGFSETIEFIYNRLVKKPASGESAQVVPNAEIVP